MKKLRFGLIGCSNIARKAFLPALHNSKLAETKAVASRDAAKANTFANDFNCEGVTGYEELLLRDDIDAVYISTPTGKHAEWVIKAAESGKHIICEKSLTATITETRNILDCCKKNQVAMLEGFAYQFHPQHSILRDIVAEGHIGKPVTFHAWFGFPPIQSEHRYCKELGGGALLDAGTYTIHAARRFFGREPVDCSSHLFFADHEVDIQGSALLNFGNGQTALLAFGFDNMYQNTYSIWGTKGKITLERAFSIPPTFSPTVIIEKQDYREERRLQTCDQFVEEIDFFASSLNNHDMVQAWRTDALNQAAVIEAFRRPSVSDNIQT